jgi:ribonuclease HII
MGLEEIMQNIEADEYLFDGNSTFGVKGLKTLIKADATIPQVSAASILAKVTHDRDILELDKLYPEYGFSKHKGYGTLYHVSMIKQYGYSDVHRKTYKIKALEPRLF